MTSSLQASGDGVASRFVAVAIPLAWLLLFTPYGMDTTDFGYFYGYAWRVLNGELPYRDFAYIKPALPVYWHAFWLWLTPEKFAILGGKIGFLASILASSWLCALFLAGQFNFSKLELPVPLLATVGFVFGVHSFPHMPWHTADGILFSTLALWLSTRCPLAAGIAAACAMACKQSFLPVPVATFIFLWFAYPKRFSVFFAAGLGATLICFGIWLHANDLWFPFRQMTTGQLAIGEAIEAGILIYIRQNWILPFLAIVPWLAAWLLRKRLPLWLYPCSVYIVLLCCYYVVRVEIEKTWIGYGDSWPTLFILLGLGCILAAKKILLPDYRVDRCRSAFCAVLAFAAPLVTAWCVAVSGGYKIPAMLATPGLFAFFLLHGWLGGNVLRLAWLTLVCGLIMFTVGYQYPYVFPQRPLERGELIYDAGQVYPQASGVKVDADMLARLSELKELREKYGPDYKTMPGFTLAYYLNGDKPVYGSDWLIDWEINGETERFYKDLLDRNLLVFMEKDQMDTKQADAYQRAGYTVPQLVRNNWKIIDETPHFAVFRAPEKVQISPDRP